MKNPTSSRTSPSSGHMMASTSLTTWGRFTTAIGHDEDMDVHANPNSKIPNPSNISLMDSLSIHVPALSLAKHLWGISRRYWIELSRSFAISNGSPPD